MGHQSTGRVYVGDRIEELASLSKDELIDRLLQVEGYAENETLNSPRRPVATRSFSSPWDTEEFVKLPLNSPNGDASQPEVMWRVVLISYDLSHAIIGLDVCGDVLIGRATDDSLPDLDLTTYGGLSYGVSRLHASLHPDADNLWLTDFGSTNGTTRNSQRMRPREPQALEDEDIISFGNLKFQVRFPAVGS